MAEGELTGLGEGEGRDGASGGILANDRRGAVEVGVEVQIGVLEVAAIQQLGIKSIEKTVKWC